MADGDSDQKTSSLTGTAGDGVSVTWIALVLLRGRRLLLFATAAGLLAAIVVIVLRPTTYTSEFAFVPQATQDGSRAGLASLAGQFGINLSSLGGQQQSPQLYADLLQTRAVLEPIAKDSFPLEGQGDRSVPLATFLNISDERPSVVTEMTLRKLRRDVISTSVAIRTTGMVTVKVRTQSRQVSYAIAERLLESLNHFNQVTRQSQAREERRFTEARLAEARKSLRGAEDSLQKFLQANRQFNDSPALRFQEDRLQREVQLQQQVVTSLAQQYEENRIREVRDTPVITMIESPEPAGVPDARLRVLITLMGLLAGLCVGVLMVLGREVWRGERTTQLDPARAALAEEWRSLRGVTAH